ncbi:bifunctional hydroxymethylpyrimidine kinase/phosphomethylpyrimidine kinase [Acetobacter cibinongensis]|uniref:hydroxymethylpyrimidine kinase n=1 Tax=Acetobacter cibinongensis TaxID=146475 RepID=A0A1Z5YU98_9PROT|nr:bifunctional hydroxymethylpyrimidine kinase/phosphomethylpyrimidine kinase [Acetobacter cibinongensis]OUJ02108.1 phosphomethylpyrimidine kinase [Acetobacter cibinongensis]
MPARVFSIAGSDSGGGAGIQADIKAITALKGYAMTAITALTAQNTLGVHGIFPVPAQFVRQQIRCVLDDIGTDAFKTGMVGEAAEVQVVAEEIALYRRKYPTIPVVVDPVMVAKGGAALLADDVVGVVQKSLFSQATVITPNLPEAERLTRQSITTRAAMRTAARLLHQETGAAVLLKGGHMEGDELVDILADETGLTEFFSQRVQTRHTHGTGCTLASALATYLAQGLALQEAVAHAREYVRQAILHAPELGHGAGPLWHAHTVPEAG